MITRRGRRDTRIKIKYYCFSEQDRRRGVDFSVLFSFSSRSFHGTDPLFRARRRWVSLRSSAAMGPAPNDPRPETSNYVKLNIGGSLFYTTVTTLSKLDSKLRDLVLSEVAGVREPSETEGTSSPPQLCGPKTKFVRTELHF